MAFFLGFTMSLEVSSQDAGWHQADFEIEGLGQSVAECNEVERVLTKALFEMDGRLTPGKQLLFVSFSRLLAPKGRLDDVFHIFQRFPMDFLLFFYYSDSILERFGRESAQEGRLLCLLPTPTEARRAHQ